MNVNSLEHTNNKSVGRLLLEFSLPAIVGMTLTSLYNIIDSIFIGHGIGPMAIAGLAVSFPLMNLVTAFCLLVSTGSSALISIRLGQKDHIGASEILAHTVMLCVINAVIFGGLTFIYLDEVLTYFGASAETLPYARSFMQVILLGTPLLYTLISLNNLMRATGYPKKAMKTSMISVFANIILAPIFIFYFGWGMRGAASATLISQAIATIWILAHFFQKQSTVHFEKTYWRLKSQIVKNIFAIGMSPFLMNVCTCLIVITINNNLLKYGGDMAVGAYGIINRILTLFVMVVIGLTLGMQPIIGYNFGAKQLDRMKRVLWLGLISAFVITTSGFACAQLFPHAISAIFTDNQELIEIAAVGIKTCMIMFPLVGIQIVITNFFQSIGKAKISIFLSLTRQLIFLLPFLYILPSKYGVSGVWMSLPISDGTASLTAIAMLFYYINRLKKKGII